MAGNPYTDSETNRFNNLRSAGLQKAITSRSRDPLKTTNKLVTNAGIAREAYFQSFGGGSVAKKNFWTAIQAKYSSNAPFAVDEASQLWSGSLANKGVISTWSRTKQISTDDYVAKKTTPGTYLNNKIRYGFAFHYNPTTVNMQYGMMPDIDPTMYTSGLESFNDLSGGLGYSTVTFNLVINRLHDMQYFNPTTGLIDPKFGSGSFAGRKPDTREQKDIWNKGTMYDIEFLLRTIVGFGINSTLGRNASWDNITSDIGYLSGIPVELHLGKGLRYTGRIENLSINHVLFTERMIPTFSEVSITFTRIPDFTGNDLLYSAEGDLDASKTTAKPTTTSRRSGTTGNAITGNPSGGSPDRRPRTP
jgi:hypothetical protein